jgi:hypothetical protein
MHLESASCCGFEQKLRKDEDTEHLFLIEGVSREPRDIFPVATIGLVWCPSTLEFVGCVILVDRPSSTVQVASSTCKVLRDVPLVESTVKVRDVGGILASQLPSILLEEAPRTFGTQSADELSGCIILLAKLRPWTMPTPLV